MTSRKVTLLAIVAIAVLVAALLLTREPSSTAGMNDAAFYPDLSKQMDSVTAISIYRAGDAKAVELTRKDGQWLVNERAGYPASAAKVNRLLLALTQAKPVEEKTSNPDSYPTLGVEDVSNSTASGTRVELHGTAKPVNLIVGKAAGSKGAYVRRAGEPASWLISESVEASAVPGDWLRTSIVDIGADRVQSATVTTGDAKPYTAEKTTRADADFKVTPPLPKGKEVDHFAVNTVASALTALTLSDVRPLSDFAADKPAAHATFRTFDGLVLDLDGWTQDGKHYVAVKPTFDVALAGRFHVEAQTAEGGTKPGNATNPEVAEKPQDAALTLAKQLDGWSYEVSDYKYEAIFKPAAALLKK